MRTWVRMSTLCRIAPRDRPYIELFEARTLEDAADSIQAQPDPSALLVYASVNGHQPRPQRSECARLAELLGLKPDSAPGGPTEGVDEWRPTGTDTG
jgi:hypothetical protein